LNSILETFLVNFVLFANVQMEATSCEGLKKEN